MTRHRFLLLATALVLVGALGLAACQTDRIAPDDAPVALASDAELYMPEIRGEEIAVITHAPSVPPPITRDYATHVLVEMETVELVKELAPGVEYNFWTFDGNAPGPFVRVREGDLVSFTLRNADDSTVPHNIDLHAVTGTGG